MPTIRIPYPADPNERTKIFRRLSSLAGRFGPVEGDQHAGSFHGSTPIGRYAGSYDSPEGTNEITIVVDKKPLLISMSRIETELRKILSNDPSAAT